MHVRGRSLDQLDALDEVSGEFVDFKASVRLAHGGTWQARAIDRHGIEVCRDATHEELVHFTFIDLRRNYRRAFKPVPNIAAYQVAISVSRYDGFDIISITLGDNRSCAALPLSGDGECLQLIY